MRQALELALEALEANYLLVNGTETHGGLEQCLDGYYSGCFDTDPINKQTEEAVTAIKEALAQPEQEPVAMKKHEPKIDLGKYAGTYGGYITPEPSESYSQKAYRLANELRSYLSIAPPQRTWVGLTDEEIDALHTSIKVRLMGTFDTKDIYRVVEQALKEKNT